MYIYICILYNTNRIDIIWKCLLTDTFWMVFSDRIWKPADLHKLWLASPVVPKERLIRGSEAGLSQFQWRPHQKADFETHMQPAVIITSWDSFWSGDYLREPQFLWGAQVRGWPVTAPEGHVAMTPDRLPLGSRSPAPVEGFVGPKSLDSPCIARRQQAQMAQRFWKEQCWILR